MLWSVRDVQLGRVVRALRHRRGWTQLQLAERVGVSDTVISEIELGRLDGQKWGVMRHMLEALAASLEALPRWRGAELERLLDADHAAITEQWGHELTARGWDVRTEVSFNEYGDRGRFDLIAFHHASRTLLVDEHKTVLADAQQTLGGLDVKVRVAAGVARRLGWNPARIVPCLVLADGRTNRRRVEQHPTLFTRFDLRGRRVLAWLRDPRTPVGGLLVYRSLPNSATSGARRAGRQRIRPRRSPPSVDETSEVALQRPSPA
jgi:transcriptional regulator with XRE-family HTH domain